MLISLRINIINLATLMKHWNQTLYSMFYELIVMYDGLDSTGHENSKGFTFLNVFWPYPTNTVCVEKIWNLVYQLQRPIFIIKNITQEILRNGYQEVEFLLWHSQSFEWWQNQNLPNTMNVVKSYSMCTRNTFPSYSRNFATLANSWNFADLIRLP